MSSSAARSVGIPPPLYDDGAAAYSAKQSGQGCKNTAPSYSEISLLSIDDPTVSRAVPTILPSYSAVMKSPSKGESTVIMTADVSGGVRRLAAHFTMPLQDVLRNSTPRLLPRHTARCQAYTWFPVRVIYSVSVSIPSEELKSDLDQHCEIFNMLGNSNSN